MDDDLAMRTTELEVKLGFTEDLLEELNRQVFRQQEQIELLQRQIIALNQQMQSMSPSDASNLRDEIPPHY